MKSVWFVRVISTIATLLVLVTVTFFLIRILPGDPALLVAGTEATEEDVANIRRSLGLDRPLIVQYGLYLKGLAQGDLGVSIRGQRPALEWTLSSLYFSAQLAVGSIVVAIIVGVSAGIAAALRPGSGFDAAIMVTSLVGISMPVYVSGLLLIWLFGVVLGLLPVAGIGGPSHLVLPSLSLGLVFSGELARMTRSAMLDVLSQDYMRTAEAKGLSRGRVVWRHGVRNAAIPILSLAGAQFARLFGTAVITESVFAWPGLGRLLVDAISWRDYPLMQAGILVFGTVIILVNSLTDVLYGIVDPRLQEERS